MCPGCRWTVFLAPASGLVLVNSGPVYIPSLIRLELILSSHLLLLRNTDLAEQETLLRPTINLNVKLYVEINNNYIIYILQYG